MIPVLRDRGLSDLLDPDARLERLAGGFLFTEGPLWLPDDTLLFQDIKAEISYKLGPTGGHASVLRQSTGAANGQTFGPDGSIFFCEQNGRRVSRMNPDGGGVRTVVETFEGKRLNSPNDIVARSDGLIYFTDPPYGAPPDRPLNFQGVYCMRPDGSALRLLVDDFEKPNGLAFSPDEKKLYVADTARNQVRCFKVNRSGEFAKGSGKVFATVDPDEPGGPDGMKVDHDGRVYVAVAQGIWVFDAGGGLLGILATPKRPSNLAWFGPAADALAITMVDEVLRVRLRVRGCRPVFQPL